MRASGPILPGATIGVLGSGQLGRMFAIAARKMGYRVHTLSPDTDTPTGQVADMEIVADYDDLDAVAEFARDVHVVTFEFANVSSAATATAARFAHWGVIENDHVNGILDVSVAPARVPAAIHDQAIAIAREILETLGVVGVLCVEFFLTKNGKLLVNELAPRPHNSGHLTFDASL